MRRLILHVLFLLLPAIPVFSKHIQGIVYDAGTGKPLSDVHVAIIGSQSGAVSDRQGHFRIALHPGTYSLAFTYLGYAPVLQEVQVPEGGLDLGVVRLDPAQTILNSNIVVTAQRQQQTAFSSPEALTIVSGRELRLNGSRTAPEALMGATGVWVQKTNHGSGSPFIRGLTGNQTLMLLDGIRLNNTTYRYGPNQYFNTVDALNADRIEVLRGAGAVLYGSDALGGTIQVFSRNPRFSEQGWQGHGSVFTRFVSADMEKTGRAELELSGQGVAFRSGFSYRDFGDLLAGGDLGVEAPSSYQERAVDAKTLVKLGKTGVATLAYNGVFQSNVGRYDQVAQRGFQLWQFHPQNRQMAYAKIKLQPRSKWADELRLTLAWQHSLEGRESQRRNNPVRTEEADKVRTLSAGLEWTVQPLGPNWSIISGAEYYHDRVNSRTQSVNNETGAVTIGRGLYTDGATAGNLAIFHSHQWTHARWQLNAGVRWNTIHLELDDPLFGEVSIQPAALVGSLSARYELDPEQALTASVNTGFRAPNINDLSSFGSFDFGVETPSPGLAPEKSLTTELGYKRRGPRLSAGAAIFRTRLFDLISRVKSTYQGQPTYQGEQVYQKANTDKAYVQGLELDADWNFWRQFALTGSLVYTYGQNQSADEPMRRIPPLNGRVALSWRQADSWFAQAELWYAGAQKRLAAGDRSDHRINPNGTPGWEVVNLKAGYQFRTFSLEGGCQNLFNEAYRIHGSGVDGVGRSWWISAGWRF